MLPELSMYRPLGRPSPWFCVVSIRLSVWPLRTTLQMLPPVASQSRVIAPFLICQSVEELTVRLSWARARGAAPRASTAASAAPAREKDIFMGNEGKGGSAEISLPHRESTRRSLAILIGP